MGCEIFKWIYIPYKIFCVLTWQLAKIWRNLLSPNISNISVSLTFGLWPLHILNLCQCFHTLLSKHPSLQHNAFPVDNTTLHTSLLPLQDIYCSCSLPTVENHISHTLNPHSNCKALIMDSYLPSIGGHCNVCRNTELRHTQYKRTPKT